MRLVVADTNGRELDLHPLTFRPDGSAVQASVNPERPFLYPATCFVTGTIQNRTVACLSESVISSYLDNHMPSSASCTR